MTIATHTYASRTARTNTLIAMMHAWQDKWSKRRAYLRTVDELSMLSDRELADLGINRSVITQTAEAAVDITRG
ncbi:DUF1127 domain-containing protein [Roseovarius sp. LXJ103]|uniref:DUF1127 domain-containing protein n=1 Tax=Roseovarius carneus TaxID=2853164 RepID=UPI000D61750C|nr:DUF1127 domain-containing protein [Roseovarius carneus]MBZ8117789.1 DUF1127 domain-containing protein [Roseovarius carneus]PWE36441.1 hypothetical protein DD563_11015 [Pelagicola sp. LXJ1103]